MKTSEEIKIEFIEKLKSLLSSFNGEGYKAEIRAEDHFQGYAECGSDIRMTVYIPSVHDKDGNTVREYTEIDLGNYIESN